MRDAGVWRYDLAATAPPIMVAIAATVRAGPATVHVTGWLGSGRQAPPPIVPRPGHCGGASLPAATHATKADSAATTAAVAVVLLVQFGVGQVSVGWGCARVML